MFCSLIRIRTAPPLGAGYLISYVIGEREAKTSKNVPIGRKTEFHRSPE